MTLDLGLQVALGIGALVLALAFGFNLGQLTGERRLNEATERMLREHRESLAELLRSVSAVRTNEDSLDNARRLGGKVERLVDVAKRVERES